MPRRLVSPVGLELPPLSVLPPVSEPVPPVAPAAEPTPLDATVPFKGGCQGDTACGGSPCFYKTRVECCGIVTS